MAFTYADYEKAAAYIKTRITITPTIGMILGSGLGALAESIDHPTTIPYAEIPNWTQGTVAGHAGRLVIGSLEGQPVLTMQGRAHFYEGIGMEAVGFPIRVMQLMGIRTLIVTNAAGGLNPVFKAGDLMTLKDHINLPAFSGNSPLMGANDERLGPRFTPLTKPYDKQLRELALSIASREGITLHEGVYVCQAGPAYETPAEVRMLRLIGGDAIGMSTAPEVVVAKHAGMRVLGFSSITNEAIDDVDSQQEVSHEEVLDVGKTIVPRLIVILRGVLREMPPVG